MSRFDYKPRHGYDIRVRPPRDEPEPPAWAREIMRECDAPECGRKATVRTAKTPRHPDEKIWLCAAHAAEHNRRWNFFDGLAEDEAEKARLSTIYGDRPTWRMGSNDRASAAARARRPRDFGDPMGLFTGTATKFSAPKGEFRDGRRLPRLQLKAFETLGLEPTAPAADIRKRYAELVRRFHPDANGGDRSAERQLMETVRAHHVLKKAGIC